MLGVAWDALEDGDLDDLDSDDYDSEDEDEYYDSEEEEEDLEEEEAILEILMLEEIAAEIAEEIELQTIMDDMDGEDFWEDDDEAEMEEEFDLFFDDDLEDVDNVDSLSFDDFVLEAETMMIMDDMENEDFWEEEELADLVEDEELALDEPMMAPFMAPPIWDHTLLEEHSLEVNKLEDKVFDVAKSLEKTIADEQDALHNVKDASLKLAAKKEDVDNHTAELVSAEKELTHAEEELVGLVEKTEEKKEDLGETLKELNDSMPLPPPPPPAMSDFVFSNDDFDFM